MHAHYFCLMFFYVRCNLSSFFFFLDPFSKWSGALQFICAFYRVSTSCVWTLSYVPNAGEKYVIIIQKKEVSIDILLGLFFVIAYLVKSQITLMNDHRLH